jgi:MFS family permease
MQEQGFVPNKLSLLTILMASMLMLMGGAAVAPALPQISEAFPEYPYTVISLIVTLPSLAIALTGLLIGIAADRWGKVKVLSVSLLVFGIAGVSGFFINDMVALLVSRFFVGVGIAGITCCCTALITEYYSGERRVRTLGYQTATMGIGILFLETCGGALATIGWHEPFLIYSIGFLLFAMALVSIREPRSERMQEDYGTERPADKGVIVLCYVTIFLLMAVMFIFPTELAEYVTQNADVPTTVIGLMLGLNGVFNASACLFYRRAAGTIDKYMAVVIGMVLMGVGDTLFIVPYDTVSVLLFTCIVGTGAGLSTTAVVNILSENASPRNSGKVMGGYTTFFNLGQFASSFIIAALLTVLALQSVFVAFGIFSLCLALIYLGIRAVIVRRQVAV